MTVLCSWSQIQYLPWALWGSRTRQDRADKLLRREHRGAGRWIEQETPHNLFRRQPSMKRAGARVLLIGQELMKFRLLSGRSPRQNEQTLLQGRADVLPCSRQSCT
jgi:hypothetical protein